MGVPPFRDHQLPAPEREERRFYGGGAEGYTDYPTL